MPELPTVAEATGYAGYEASTWKGFVLPAEACDLARVYGRSAAVARCASITLAAAVVAEPFGGYGRSAAVVRCAGRLAEADQQAARGLALLRRAAAAGYFQAPDQAAALRTDDDFAGLRGHVGWQPFLKEVSGAGAGSP